MNEGMYLDLYGEMTPNVAFEGGYRTRTFVDVFEDEDSFKTFLTEECGIPCNISETSIQTLFYLLYARYGNSHIASSDENQFKYKVAGIIFQYGPTWQKRLELQSEIRELTISDAKLGNVLINNHAYNPSTLPQTSTEEYLTKIDQQNVTISKRSDVDGYNMLIELLETDVTEQFLKRFKKLFITIVNPELPLLYDIGEDI